MRHPDHLVIAFHKQRRNRERRAFEASEAVFDVVLVTIFPHPLLQRQALLWGIAGIGTPAQRRDDLGNRLLVVLDRRDLIAHPLAHLLGAIGPTPSAPDELDCLLTLAVEGVGKRPRHSMPRHYPR